MFSIQTNHPVAVNSPDHLIPHGTKDDNTKSLSFVRALEELYPKPIRLLDIGCAGGGMVEDFVNRGHLAVGVEGSDYSLIRKRAAWGTVPDNLFTADAAEPFQVLEDGKPFKADVLTSWGVFEHFTKSQLPSVCENMRKHLPVGGIVVGNIGVHWDQKWHQIIEPRPWWKGLFEAEGFVEDEVLIKHFDGRWMRLTDWPEHVFYVVYKRIK